MNIKNVIDWKRLTDEKPVSGHEYLVAIPYNSEHTALMYVIAEYYDVGDRLLIMGKKPTHRPEVFARMSPEERLVRAVLDDGSRFHTVTKAGFYTMLTVNDDNPGLEPTDYEYPDCLSGEDVFWAYLPEPPKGYASSEDYESTLP